MKAQELRIGNKVIDSSYPTLVSEIEQLHSEYAITSYSDSISYEYLQPIPLTPELLEKCGFVDALGGYQQKMENNHVVIITWYDDTQKRVFLNSNYIGIIHLQYLHELQNLIFALTGTELTITL